MNKKTRRLNFVVDEEVYERLRMYAFKNDKTMTDVVVELIKEKTK